MGIWQATATKAVGFESSSQTAGPALMPAAAGR